MKEIDSHLKPQEIVCAGGTGRVSSRMLFFFIVAIVGIALAVFVFEGNLNGRSGTEGPKKAVSSPSRQK